MDAKRPGTSIGWRPQTRLVRGGLARSEFGETAEAIYLTSGYVYDDAEQAEARFQNKDPGYIYSRYGNPTVTMFEERMCLLEGAAGLARRGQRHGGGQRRAHVPGAGRRPRGGLARPLRLLPLHHRGAAAALRRDDDAGRRARSRSVAHGAEARRALRLHRDAGQPDPRADRHQGGGRPRPRGGRALHRRQRVRHADPAEADPARRRHRRLLGHQAHRRPGPLPRRRRAGRRRSSSTRSCSPICATPARRSRRSTPG